MDRTKVESDLSKAHLSPQFAPPDQEPDHPQQVNAAPSFGGPHQLGGQGMALGTPYLQPVPVNVRRDVISVGGALSTTTLSKPGKESSPEAFSGPRRPQFHMTNSSAEKESKMWPTSLKGAQARGARSGQSSTYH